MSKASPQMSEPSQPSRPSPPSRSSRGAPATGPSAGLGGWQPSRRLVVIVGLVLAALYLGAVNNHWRIGNDAAMYLSVGRSLAEGQGLSYNNGQAASGSPGLPMLIGVCFKLCGEVLWPINLLLALAGLGVAVLTYRLVRLWTDRRAALLCLLLVGLSVINFESSHRIESDVPALFFMMATLWCLARFTRRGSWGWLGLGIVFMFAMIGMRVVGIVMVLPLALGLICERSKLSWRRRVLAGVALVAAVLAAGGLATLVTHASVGSLWATANIYLQAAMYRMAAIWQVMARLIPPLLQFPANVSQLLIDQAPSGTMAALLAGLPLFLLTAWGLLAALRGRRFLVVWPVVGYVAFLIFIWSGPAVRYLLLVYPLLVYLLVIGATALAEKLARRRPGFRPHLAVGILVGLVVLANVPKVFYKEIGLAHHPNYERVADRGRLARWQTVAEAIRGQSPGRGDVVLAEHASVVHFLTRQTALYIIDAPPASDGLWNDIKQVLAQWPVRFMVLPRKRDPQGLFEALYEKNIGRSRLVLDNADFQVLESPPEGFIYPGNPPPGHDLELERLEGRTSP